MGGPYILWSWADHLKGDIFSPWIRVKSSAMKVDSGLVMVAIPVTKLCKLASVHPEIAVFDQHRRDQNPPASEIF